MEFPEELNEIIAKRKEASPELFEKFGDPRDENDPRFWSPSEREEKGVSTEDRLRFLELDVEALTLAMAPILKDHMVQKAQDMAAKLKADPIGFLTTLMEQGTTPEEAVELITELTGLGNALTNVQGSYGPNGESGPAYAGSTQGLTPETMVDSVNGPIRADQIPGYRNDPSWRPSPDWVDANCTCEEHKLLRARNNDGDADGGFSGMYL